ncbi:protein-glutamate O-methyltransferase CheR [uncultured Neptuniibacter sp.]|uniref:CheR family methyltransferase n=1 Tax=uncultured Neptuniibacter sp. TaxID=502143 RepID=UPI00261599E7|nr:protein-glutamate O-methyltransferase CheR [uncultured Neptuniibacter sp.]
MSIAGRSSFTITDADFELFSRFLEDNSGILLAKHKQYLVQSRLGKIVQEQGCPGLKELISKLQSPASKRLREQVIDAMTTNETLWFRDVHPFDILRDRILPEMTGAGGMGSRVRIWSAACSTGQEPYSISITFDEFKKKNPGKLSSGEIIATDISTQVLEQARRGEYEMLAIGRGLSQERLTQHFRETPSGSWAVKPEIKSGVRFQSINLLGQYSAMGKFDVIFCRNVLIYFSSEKKLEILSKMHGVLKPGGYLILGASEFLSGLSDKYKMIHCRPGIIYQAI